MAFYFLLRYVLIKQIDEDLEIEEEEIRTYVGKHDRLPENIEVADQVINYTQVTEKGSRQFTTTKMIDTEDSIEENFRQLVFDIKAGGQLYKATVTKSLEGSNHLLQSILLISISTILAISFLIPPC